MAVVKSDGKGDWSYKLPDEGWHTVVIHETIEVRATKKDPAKKMMAIPLCFDGGDKPINTIFCMLDNVSGLRKIVDVVVATGVGKNLKQEKKIDLTVGVDENVIKSEKFLNYVMSKMSGKGFQVKVQHGTYEATDDAGNKSTKPQVNIIEVMPLGSDASVDAPTDVSPATAKPESTGW